MNTLKEVRNNLEFNYELNYGEYIVYNSKQIEICYIAKVKFNYF